MNVTNENKHIHSVLNPLLWNSDNALLQDVESRLIDTIKLFKDHLDDSIDIIDAYIVGSNASYNYTQLSDLDVHVMANFESVEASKEFVHMLYDASKISFNLTYNILIHGISVELYVEDITSPSSVRSNGIYSIFNRKWIKQPVKLDNTYDVDITASANVWKSRIDSALQNDLYDYTNTLINKLYMIRKNSLMTDGEFGKGNLLFKEIRNSGYMDKMKDFLHSIQSKRLSLEDFRSTSCLLRDMSSIE